MKIRFLGAAQTVTGSFFVMETSHSRFAIDCGLFQGGAEVKERNYQPFRIDPASLDFMVLTHAHIDHSGLIPKLYHNGFKGPIYCSSATAALVSILLPDSAHIQESEIERKNRKNSRAGKAPLQPIYTMDDAQACLKQLKSLKYDQVANLAPDVDLRLRDAGHILGSSMLEIWIKEDTGVTKLVFSGDLGNYSQRIIKDPTIIEQADYLFLESTYGNRLHEANTYRIDQLADIIEITMKKGGNLVIPAFAVERTQDLLYDLSLLSQQGRLSPDINVYIDSPLAVAATEIFENSKEYFDEETQKLLGQGVDPFQLPNLKFSRTREESMKLNENVGKNIIISASGMADAGRIKHHLRHNLWRPESTVLFVGYQAAGTLGRRLLDGEKLVTIHGEQVTVKADIRHIDSYSAHADQAGIMTWLKHFTSLPKTVFLIHGEPASLDTLAQMIRDQLKVDVAVPKWLDEIELGLSVLPQEAAQPIATAPATVTFTDQAMLAEQTYMEFRLKANQLFQKQWDAKQYDQLIKQLNAAMKILNES